MINITADITGLIIFFIGIYGLISSRNVIKNIMAISIMDGGIILFFLSINLPDNPVVPIGDSLGPNSVDPLPQALMITAIVIGVTITAIALTMFINLYHQYNSTNWKNIYDIRKENK